MDRLRLLEEENDALRARIRDLEGLLGYRVAVPRELGLTGIEERVFGCLLVKPVATKEMVYHALYGDHVGDPPHQKIIDVVICKIRKKLEGYPVAIETVWGRGYAMPAESKAFVSQMLEKANGGRGRDDQAPGGGA